MFELILDGRKRIVTVVKFVRDDGWGTENKCEEDGPFNSSFGVGEGAYHVMCCMCCAN